MIRWVLWKLGFVERRLYVVEAVTLHTEGVSTVTLITTDSFVSALADAAMRDVEHKDDPNTFVHIRPAA